MIPNETLQSIDTIGSDIRVVGNFRITEATQARILISLSDKMYTRKELAVIREISTNSVDAHTVVGKPIGEIIISLPTMMDLTFRVRDFGTGLTEKELVGIFCVFGESTKRNSNDYVGILGYGAKSPFAVTDSFTVTSWINGEKSIYQCIKGDSTKLHSAILLSRNPSDEPTGIEVTIPVEQSKVWTFHREAIDFFKYWPELPTINNFTEEETAKLGKFRNTPATLKGDGWEVRPKSDGSARGVAYMGWVPYNIDWNTLYHRMSLDSKKRVLFDLLQNNDVTLYFNMGEIQFVDSRESLEYTDMTLAAVIARVEGIFGKIKDAIQEKFDPLANIWDAKLMYNAIFGTGVLEVEKGESDEVDMGTRIKILAGNLMNLEVSFRGMFKWNGIVIDDASFDRINRFDNTTGIALNGKEYTPHEPVMVTYRKKKSRVKTNRCKGDANNRIVASTRVAVVLNDTGKKTGQSLISRYLIFGAKKNIKTVHILTFADSAIKDAFFKEYHFDTVPVIKLSEIIIEARQWNSINKVSHSYGGGGSGTRTMKYMDVENKSVKESDVPVREIENGAFYVEVGEGRRNHGKLVSMYDQWHNEAPENIVAHIKALSGAMDLEIERVYIINKQTSAFKWFKEAIASGEWISLWKHIEENLNLLNVDTLVNAVKFAGINTACEKASKVLRAKISNKNSPMLKLVELVGDENQKENIKIVHALHGLYYWIKFKGESNGTIDYEKVTKAAQANYPFLQYTHLENDFCVDDETLQNVVNYVNAIDLYIDLTCDTSQPLAVQEPEKNEVLA